MSSVHLRFRQVHLDFHTSAVCEDVGADFDPQVFAETVKMGHVNSMTIFARCHHGFSYYPTMKTRDQLDYECGTIVGAGGKISIGDQLHPRGVLDPAVYRLLGHAFGRIEQIEPWLEGARPTAEVAILSQLGPMTGMRIPRHSDDVEGAAQCFLESAIQFDSLIQQCPISLAIGRWSCPMVS